MYGRGGRRVHRQLPKMAQNSKYKPCTRNTDKQDFLSSFVLQHRYSGQNGRSRCTNQCRTCKGRRNFDARNNPDSSERGPFHVRRSLTIMHILEDGSRTDNRIGSAEFTLPPKTKGPPAHCKHATCLNLKSNGVSFANQYRA